MGFFSDIAQEARRGLAQQSGQPVRTAPAPFPPAVPDPEPVPPAQAEKPVPVPVAPAPEAPADAAKTPPLPDIPATEPAKTGPVSETPPEPPEKQPVPPAIDLTPEADAEDDDARRKAHEAAEARRKAEFDARQAEKNAARRERLDRIAAMSDEDASAGAVTRIGTDTERLTRRNMKEAVCEYVQDQCRRNPNIARLALRPEKSMANCFRYINRMAREYAEQEMKDNGIERTGVYGLDVPDGLVYQWAMDYFDDPDAKEDHVNEEKFVPKPYVPSARKASKAKAEKKKPAPEKPKAPALEQMSLM